MNEKDSKRKKKPRKEISYLFEKLLRSNSIQRIVSRSLIALSFIISLILGLPFIFRIKFLESQKSKIKIFSDEHDLLQTKLNKESKELKEISQFNN